MGKGWGVNTSELDGMLKRLQKADADLDRIARTAISAGYPIVREEMARQMPRSVKPKKPTLKEPWRGVHAADSTYYMRPKYRVSLRRTTVYALVGPDRLKSYSSVKTALNTGGKHFYMWYVVRGRAKPNGGYVKGRPYVRSVSAAVKHDVTEAMKKVLLKELERLD